jgi:hypothetical protein
MPQRKPAHRLVERLAPALPLLAALGACGSSDNGVGGVTAGEATALNQAAEMLDARSSAPPGTEAVSNNARAAKTVSGK